MGERSRGEIRGKKREWRERGSECRRSEERKENLREKGREIICIQSPTNSTIQRFRKTEKNHPMAENKTRSPSETARISSAQPTAENNSQENKNTGTCARADIQRPSSGIIEFSVSPTILDIDQHSTSGTPAPFQRQSSGTWLSFFPSSFLSCFFWLYLLHLISKLSRLKAYLQCFDETNAMA